MIRSITAIFFSSVFLINANGAMDHAVQPKELSIKNNLVYSDTETPFLHESFKFGTVTMKSGRVIRQVKFRVNLVSNETECIFSGDLPAILNKGAVKEISFADTTQNGIFPYKLKTGYPPFDRQTRDNFYIILTEGRCTFLRSVEKKVTEKVNDMDHSIIKEYETYEEYYFFSNGAVKRWKKDKEFVLGEMADKQEQVNKFAGDNKTNFRSMENVIQLITYYNSL
jgi:hypothetical protein